MNSMPEKIGNNYRIIRKIDEGAFGEIYHGINVMNNQEVAIKLEPVNTESPQLIY